ncbi:MAG: TPM domain-containing protein [Candidatus Gottesmanbacteria bacterium]|nr:TPM domain-containing protein [Candidatus Gottesmanbacteria bacterium]
MSRLFVVFASAIFAVRIVAATTISAPTGHVTDVTGVLSPTEKQSIEDTLLSYQESSGNEIAVALIRSLDGDTIEEKAVRLFEAWKIGKKGKDNGVLLLAAIDDRKMRIEVGYGLEPLLTDGEAGEIIRNTIAPEFKKTHYAGGISAGISAIEGQLSGSVTGGGSASTKQDDTYSNLMVVIVLIALFCLHGIFVYFCSYLARSKSIWLGGLVGGGLGMVIGLILPSFTTGIIAGGALGGLGFILDSFLSKRYTTLKETGKPTDWWSTGGGFWGGGTSGKSSGFGGFGGGSSGGGGASGSW